MKPILIIILTAATAWAAGPLTPPGPPAPTMKTLDQVEARTPIESLPFVISSPGSYYFTGNLEFSDSSGNAITITSDNVTLDLEGFTLSSIAEVTGHAIHVHGGLNNIAIRDGNIAGNTTVAVNGTAPNLTWTMSASGFDTGITASSYYSSRNLVVERIHVNGCRTFGIAADQCTVNDCSVKDSFRGIHVNFSSVANCRVIQSRDHGIISFGGSVTDSTASSNGGSGIIAERAVVTNCMTAANGGSGIVASSGSVTNSVARENNLSSIPGELDLKAPHAVVSATKYGTGSIAGKIPIENLPVIISSPGSYYFTENLEFSDTSGDAIKITSGNVTLDLGGFTLSSTSGVTGSGVKVNGDLSNVVIKNGNISGNSTVTISGTAPNQTWVTSAAGFAIGIDVTNVPNTSTTSISVDRVRVDGCRATGISAQGGVITNCIASFNVLIGIVASKGGNVASCTAQFNGQSGISAADGTVTSSRATFNGFVGIGASRGSVTDSMASNNGGDGIAASHGSVNNSTAMSNGSSGIAAAFGSVTSCVTKENNTSSTVNKFDLQAPEAVVAFTKYGTGDTTGSTLTGNLTP
ncbi:MAG: right-handed parallel beta-helix repeat-containing protein [Prosthecobacter sp.]